jgi:hypothetical protein
VVYVGGIVSREAEEAKGAVGSLGERRPFHNLTVMAGRQSRPSKNTARAMAAPGAATQQSVRLDRRDFRPAMTEIGKVPLLR